eukprot:s6_g35.t1
MLLMCAKVVLCGGLALYEDHLQGTQPQARPNATSPHLPRRPQHQDREVHEPVPERTERSLQASVSRIAQDWLQTFEESISFGRLLQEAQDTLKGAATQAAAAPTARRLHQHLDALEAKTRQLRADAGGGAHERGHSTGNPLTSSHVARDGARSRELLSCRGQPRRKADRMPQLEQ